MIYYFSGTGNSKWVAQKLAEKLGDEAISIVDMIKEGISPSPVNATETLGIVFPVYGYAPAKYVIDFVKKLHIDKSAFVFAVATCEGEAGAAFSRFRPWLYFDSCYTLLMPNNFVMWGLVKNKEASDRRIIEAVIPDIEDMTYSISRRKKEIKRPAEAFRLLKSYILAPLFRMTRSDRRFYSDDKCNGCGNCVTVCPISDIELVGGKPHWKHKKCMHCTACINRCPEKAIQYGNATQNSGRYIFPHEFIK